MFGGYGSHFVSSVEIFSLQMFKKQVQGLPGFTVDVPMKLNQIAGYPQWGAGFLDEIFTRLPEGSRAVFLRSDSGKRR